MSIGSDGESPGGYGDTGGWGDTGGGPGQESQSNDGHSDSPPPEAPGFGFGLGPGELGPIADGGWVAENPATPFGGTAAVADSVDFGGGMVGGGGGVDATSVYSDPPGVDYGTDFGPPSTGWYEAMAKGDEGYFTSTSGLFGIRERPAWDEEAGSFQSKLGWAGVAKTAVDIVSGFFGLMSGVPGVGNVLGMFGNAMTPDGFPQTPENTWGPALAGGFAPAATPEGADGGGGVSEYASAPRSAVAYGGGGGAGTGVPNVGGEDMGPAGDFDVSEAVRAAGGQSALDRQSSSLAPLLMVVAVAVYLAS